MSVYKELGNELKNFISAKTEEVDDKVEAIDKHERYVNTDLDYCYLKITENSNTTINQNDIIQFNNLIETNMDVNIENYSIILKQGKKYLLSADIHVSNTGYVNFCFYDLTNDKNLGYFAKSSNAAPTSTSGKCIYIPENDCEVQIKVNSKSDNNDVSLSPWTWPNSYFIVQEINRQIVIDPVEHVNTIQGIEDTPVGHIIAHMGTIAPKHYLVCDGTEYNITDYPYLAQHIEDNFGSINFFGGDGENTFCVPDLRGEFLRGTGTATRNTGSGTNVGVHQNPTSFPYIGTYSRDTNMSDYWIGGYTKIGQVFPQNRDKDTDKTSVGIALGRIKNNMTSEYKNQITTFTSRPTNTAVLYCIKYEPTYFMNTYNTNYMQPSMYSEEERVVGCWVNGKPLYEKVFVLDVVPASSTLIHTVIDSKFTSDKYEMHLVTGTFLNNRKNRTYAIPYNSGTAQLIPNIGLNGLCIYYLNANKLFNLVIVVQYTKTTDEENSFTNDMLKDSYVELTYTDEEIYNEVASILSSESNKGE